MEEDEDKASWDPYQASKLQDSASEGSRLLPELSSAYRNATSSSSGTDVSDWTEALKLDPKCLINVH